MTEASPAPAGLLGDPKGRLVLIVDDDDATLNLLEILVRRDGFSVILASTGEGALSQLQQKPDGILLDLMLPGGISGLEVLRRLKQDPAGGPPVLVVTAYAQSPELREVSRHPNVVEVITKPIRQDKLLQALHRALKTRPPRPAGPPKET